ncbi:MAG: acetoacetate--CoA ligase [Myxococcales bacterium]|nr:acetoacetate--CoA ligase [Myxococcales bacterium]
MSETPAEAAAPSAPSTDRVDPLTDFTRALEARTGRRFADHAALHRFSIDEAPIFWRAFAEFSGLRWSGEAVPAISGGEVETARFFPAMRLNYAENLLYPRGDAERAGPDAEVITGWTEAGDIVRWTRGVLRDRVERLARGLRDGLKLKPGDRVCAVARNTPETIAAALACAAVGAVWSSVAPDMGAGAILDRFRQVRPTVLFTDTQFTYQGRTQPLAELVATLLAEVPDLRAVITLDDADLPAELGAGRVAVRKMTALGGSEDAPFDYPRLPFDHPLFILFSSGTTGAPKCIVHGAGGTLIEHVKEHRLHGGLTGDDVLYFHTTTGWMMWNWQLTALASGTRVVLLDGSVSHPAEDSLLRLVDAEGVTVFGTSPVYLQYLDKAGIVPRERFGFAALRTIMSTGAVLHAGQFAWVAEHFKDVPVHSISGGTDIVGCFVLGRPDAPVRAGYSQAISLGYDVQVMTAEGPRAAGTGELICCAPFPSRPVGLFGDDEGERFHAAYFAENPGVWTHGDFLELTEDGQARVLGRADGVLNIRGIRIGPAEIYAIVQDFEAISACLAIGQEDPQTIGGLRLVLLVVMAPGHTLDRPLQLKIKKALKTGASMAHVPAVIAAVEGLPTTHSGKLSERAATDALAGRPVRNRDALRNPETLDALAAHPDLQLTAAR